MKDTLFTLTLLDYANNKVEFTLTKPFKAILISVVTGDEIAYVTYDDNSIDIFDSSKNRLDDYNDYDYWLYNEDMEIDIYDDFALRKNSYDMKNKIL